MKTYKINKRYRWNPAKLAANIRRLEAASSSNLACFILAIAATTGALYFCLLAMAALI